MIFSPPFVPMFPLSVACVSVIDEVADNVTPVGLELNVAEMVALLLTIYVFPDVNDSPFTVNVFKA